MKTILIGLLKYFKYTQQTPFFFVIFIQYLIILGILVGGLEIIVKFLSSEIYTQLTSSNFSILTISSPEEFINMFSKFVLIFSLVIAFINEIILQKLKIEITNKYKLAYILISVNQLVLSIAFIVNDGFTSLTGKNLKIFLISYLIIILITSYSILISKLIDKLINKINPNSPSHPR